MHRHSRKFSCYEKNKIIRIKFASQTNWSFQLKVNKKIFILLWTTSYKCVNPSTLSDILQMNDVLVCTIIALLVMETSEINFFCFSGNEKLKFFVSWEISWIYIFKIATALKTSFTYPLKFRYSSRDPKQIFEFFLQI